MNDFDKKIKKLQEIIDSSDNIVFFGGAGVSTDSGIKDFRGSNGLYKEAPEYMLSNRCFFDETDKFYEFYKKYMNPLSYEPNVIHKYLARLEEKGKLRSIVTQNIDGLHQRAGNRNVLEIHGTVMKNYCLNCNKEYSAEYVFGSTGIPKCICGGIIKPDVVLYGEMLPECFDIAQGYIYNADTLIVAGTSLMVSPARDMIRLFRGKNLVILNHSETSYDHIANLVIHDNLSKIFSKLK